MARTPSRMLALGTQIPDFSLPDTVSGKLFDSSTLVGQPSVVFFICNHCPFVKHIRSGIADFGRFCEERGARLVAVSSNDAVAYPAVARAFDAACTPDLYIFDANGKLAYRGQFDGARPGNDVPVSGRDARAAVL